jgi:hypothetical protein
MHEDSPASDERTRSVWMLRCELCGRHDPRTRWDDPDDADPAEVSCEGCGSSVFSLVEGWPD